MSLRNRGVGAVAGLGCLAAAVIAMAAAPPRVRPPLPRPLAAVEVEEAAIVVAAPEQTRVQVFVELSELPAVKVWAEQMALQGGGKMRVSATAVSAARSQLVQIEAEQLRVLVQLESPAIGAVEIFRVGKVLNGISVWVEPGKMEAIRRIPGVKAVHIVEPEYPTSDTETPSTATSVPFIRNPQVWDSLGLNATGAGIRIGIIDSGIDYQHADMGGTGLLADYQANNRAVITEVGAAAFPTAKVVGGWDFAGDAYTGGNAPAPDPDPMDCLGHGSHVAGIAAGVGVNSDGTPYTGPYGPTTPFGSLRIGPGAAPQALLYSLRVFGCGGSTGLTVNAINWAVDPNNDSDFSDHLDVINMSLGSRFGRTTSTSAMASDNAALAGIIVVCSAGNEGDTYFITGSPGAATRAISTASVLDDGQAGVALVVNAPPAIAASYPAAPSSYTDTVPPVPQPSGQTANVVAALDPSDGAGALTTDACSALTNAAAVVGNIAIVDRGTCGFVVKVLNCQAAGAIGVIVADNVVGDPVPAGMGGAAAGDITIPALRVSRATGDLIRAQLAIPAVVNATLAAANAGDQLSSFSSRGPRLADSPVFLKPDIAAPGDSITNMQTGITCTGSGAGNTGCIVSNATGYLAGSQTLTIGGTSMASPHMAGTMALLRQLHPDWTVEQLKALAMNYATHDVFLGANHAIPRFPPSRMGAGRVDTERSAPASVIAYNADDPGAVSVSFGTEVVGSLTRTKKVRVVNQGATAQTYDLAIDTVLDSPGVSFSAPTTVTVPAADVAELTVTLDAPDARLMDHLLDPTVALTQAAPSPVNSLGSVPRHYLSEETGYLTFSQGGNLRFRLPLYSAPRPASMMTGAGTINTGGANTTTIALTGTDVCTGTYTPGSPSTCGGTLPQDVVSLVSPFELQVVSPPDPVNSWPYTDLQYAGVAHDSVTVWFGLSTWGDWSSPTDVAFNIYIDCGVYVASPESCAGLPDGTYDKVIFNSNPASVARLYGSTASQQDSFGSFLFRPPGTIGWTNPLRYLNGLSALNAETVAFNNNVMIAGALLSQLVVNPADAVEGRLNYYIDTCPGSSPLCQSLSGFHYDRAGSAATPFQWNANAPGLQFGSPSQILYFDLNNESLPVTFNTANMTTNGSLGALLLHHHNAHGKRAQVVPLDTAPTADLSVTKLVAPLNPGLGQNVTITVTAFNAGPNDASGVIVSTPLPMGLTYVSDDGGGAFASGSGVWTIGALANSASATLNIVATVETTQELEDPAQIIGTSPVDPNMANNEASFIINAADLADLELTMTSSPGPVTIGTSITYTLTLTNHGDGTEPAVPNDITNLGDDTSYSVNVGETFATLPLLNPTSYVASAGVYNPSTGQWDLASLGKGATATLQITVPAPYMIGNLTDQGTASASTSDPDSGNNTAQASTFVISPSQLAGSTKTVAPTANNYPGQIVTYTVTLINNSQFDQFDNPGNEFYDVLPAQVTLLTSVASSGTATPDIPNNAVSWSGLIPGYGSVTITITAQINAGAEGQTVANQGTISYDLNGDGVNEATTYTDDPALGGQQDATAFDVAAPIPTLTWAGLAALALLVALLGLAAVSRRWIS